MKRNVCILFNISFLHPAESVNLKNNHSSHQFFFKCLLNIHFQVESLQSGISLTCSNTLREKCPYSEFLWSLFSSIRTEYGDILCISPYSVRMRENTDQKNSEYEHFSHSDGVLFIEVPQYFIGKISQKYSSNSEAVA